MAKVVEGVAIIAGAVIATVLTGGLASPLLASAIGLTVTGTAISLGTSLLLNGISQALQPGPSIPFSIKQAAANRQYIYGQARVAGTIVYESTSGNNHDLNQIVVFASHPCQSIQLYLDGRALFTSGDTGTHFDDSGNSYDFKAKAHFSHSLGPVPGTYFSDLGSRDSKWNSGCTLDGLTASYIRCEFDPNIFPSPPGIKATIKGKNDIYDPRTGTRGYSNNAALVIADVLMNPDFGLGCDYSEIDEDVLIASANLADEQIVLAAGGTESRYTLNGFFDSSSTPGDIIQAMLDSCAGRLSYQGGKFQILVGAWYGSGLEFWDYDIVGPVKWTKRKTRDLVNAVRATYISPKYPYAVVGYDQDNRDPNIFSGAWEPADAPEYSQDPDHGYVSDANLAADGKKLYTSLGFRFCTSVSMAQRLMKIYLMRNRQQWSATLKMSLSAYLASAGDVIQVTHTGMGWNAKYFEVQSMRFITGSTDTGGDEENAPTLQCELEVVETDPSLYLWSTAEERTVTNAASPDITNAWSVNPPTNLTLESGLDSAVVGADNVVIPRVKCQWIEPADTFTLSAGKVELQWQWANDTPHWHSEGFFDPRTNIYFLANVVAGVTYNIRVRAIRSNGASSDWVTAFNHVVSTTAVSNFTIGQITGLGSLASKNFVDFASADVANRHAQYLQYSTGLSVEALRPAEAGAEITTGKSIDILTDGTTYSRIKGTELTAGTVQGKSYGSNLLGNPGFESNRVNTAVNVPLPIHVNVSDDWFITDILGFEIYHEAFAHTGSFDLLIRVPGQTAIPGSVAARVISPKYPIRGGASFYFGGYIGWTSVVGLVTGLTILQRVGVIYFDAAGNWVGEDYPPDNGFVGNGSVVGYGWTKVSKITTAPSNAAYIMLECSAFNTGPGATSGGGISADLHFDDLWLNEIYDSSAILNPQGSILPNQLVTITYTYTKNSISFSWLSQTLRRSDGSSLTVPAGTLSYTGLSPSRNHYVYWRVNASTGALGVTNGTPPPLVPDTLRAAQMADDGFIPIGVTAITTLDVTNDGTGSGTSAWNGLCPEANELVDIEGKGQIKAGDVQIGDKIKGKTLANGEDVYREVVQIMTEASVSWRMVSGHRVSPCESVYWAGEWMPAFRVPRSTFDSFSGTKVLISVASDQYDEQNYYLVSGDVLLIHNYAMLPC